ncbi:MAG: hypothetical protein FD152_988 [Xanthobacteraceae bacterium]|nr:MAG: hypothetical protein FD152_988 [Xanthobacteraceae bacterium]
MVRLSQLPCGAAGAGAGSCAKAETALAWAEPVERAATVVLSGEGTGTGALAMVVATEASSAAGVAGWPAVAAGSVTGVEEADARAGAAAGAAAGCSTTGERAETSVTGWLCWLASEKLGSLDPTRIWRWAKRAAKVRCVPPSIPERAGAAVTSRDRAATCAMSRAFFAATAWRIGAGTT